MNAETNQEKQNLDPNPSKKTSFRDSALLLLAGTLTAIFASFLFQISQTILGLDKNIIPVVKIAIAVIAILGFTILFYNYLKKLTTTYHFAVITFLFIIVATAIGTFIPQWGTFNSSFNLAAEYYANRYGDFFSNIVLFLQIQDLYHSWWYVSLYFFIFLSLIRVMINRKFSYRNLGFHLTHIALLIIMLGSWIDNIWGMKGIIPLTKGKSSNRLFLDGRDAKGHRLPKDLDIHIRLDDFESKYYKPDYMFRIIKTAKEHKIIEEKDAKGHVYQKKILPKETVASIPIKKDLIQRIYNSDISFKILTVIPDYYIKYVPVPLSIADALAFDRKILNSLKDEEKELVKKAYQIKDNQYLLNKELKQKAFTMHQLAAIFEKVDHNMLSSNMKPDNPEILIKVEAGKDFEHTGLLKADIDLITDPFNKAQIKFTWDFSVDEIKKPSVNEDNKMNKHTLIIKKDSKNMSKLKLTQGEEYPLPETSYKLKFVQFYNHFSITAEKKYRNASDEDRNPAIHITLSGEGIEEPLDFVLYAKFEHPLHQKIKDLIGQFEFQYVYHSDKQKSRKKVIIAGKDQLIYKTTDGINFQQEKLDYNRPYRFFKSSKMTCTLLQLFPDINQVFRLPKIKSQNMINPLIEIEVNSNNQSHITKLKVDSVYHIPDSNYIIQLNSTSHDVNKQWKSHVSILKDSKVMKKGIIEVNYPLEYSGYRFYQTDADPRRPNYSGIGFSYDPGLWIVYLGFILLSTGILVIFYLKPKKKKLLESDDDTKEAKSV